MSARKALCQLSYSPSPVLNYFLRLLTCLFSVYPLGFGSLGKSPCQSCHLSGTVGFLAQGKG